MEMDHDELHWLNYRLVSSEKFPELAVSTSVVLD